MSPAARPDDAPLIRPADASHAVALVSLVDSAYRGEASRRGWTTEADLLDGQRVDLTMMDEVLADPEAVVLVAVEGTGSAAGLLGCCEVRRDGPGRASFGMFAVDPVRQAAGIGAALLAAAEALAAGELGATRMTMSVIDARHELIEWYERKGYRPTGEHRPFPYGDERFGRPRRDDLRFAVLTKVLGDGPDRAA